MRYGKEDDAVRVRSYGGGFGEVGGGRDGKVAAAARDGEGVILWREIGRIRVLSAD